MTQPRCILPGTTVLITRRSMRRTHLFRPDPEIAQLYLYVLAVVAKRHDILVHGVVLMSTHEHLVVTDRKGRLPLFMQELHRLFALGVKVLRKWEGAVWDHERPSVVVLRTPEAILEKLAYVIANPVAAGLVAFAKDWPGVTTLPEQLGLSRFRASRPDYYFDQDNPLWPEEAEIELSMPTINGMTPNEIREVVAREVAEQEEQARASVRARGWSVLGAKNVRRASPYGRAKSWEPSRGRNPHFAVGRHQKRAFFDAVAALRAFRSAYCAVLTQWRQGLRDVTFPAGTWVMRVLHGAAVVETT
jgi:putative transposase